MRALVEKAGFRLRMWDDVTAEAPATLAAALPAYAISKLVMGDALEAITEAGSGAATSAAC